MAFLYTRKASVFWWINFVHANGQRVRQSTGLRIDSTKETRKAQALKHKITAKELSRGGDIVAGRWDKWVESFLKLRYADSPKTLLRYSLAWRNVHRFFEARHVATPNFLTYQHCVDFLEWRRMAHPKLGSYAGSHNTALTELKVLGLIQREAVRRGFADENPCQKMGIRRHDVDAKPIIPDEHLAAIQRELKSSPQWMRVCFQIGLHTGLRLNETRLWMPDVDTKERTIFLRKPKGGMRRAFSIPYDDALAPLLNKLKSQRGATWAFDWPKNLPSKEWFLFFARLAASHGLPRYSFHCLRVTFVTRGAKAGVPEAVMMKLVNHAGTTVHRAYQRLTFEDARPYLAKLHPKISAT